MNRLADAIEQAVSGTGTELARAKVNLALHVTGRRVDGYHLLDSLVVFADYADMLSAVPAAGDKTDLTVHGPFADELELLSKSGGNLVTRAADALSAIAPKAKRQAANLILTKRIPIAAGLGGGSADAAAALRLLNRHWKLGLGDKPLIELGQQLGADVPMCLASRPVRTRGIGDQLTPVTGLPALPLVLAHPSVPLSTPAVFKRLESVDRAPMPSLPPKFASTMDFVFWLRQTRNDLSAAAKAELKLADAAVKALAADSDCLIARMSGSGAAAFGIFISRAAAERATERLRVAKPHWWFAAATTGAS